MDILHDRRILEIISRIVVAINAAGVCIIGGSRLYFQACGRTACRHGGGAYTLCRLLSRLFRLLPLSTTRPWIKQQSADTTVKRLIKPDKTLCLRTRVLRQK